MSNADPINAAAKDLARSGRAALVQFGLAWVWIADVAEVFASQADRATFGAMLAAERGAVDLSRCDYVEGFSAEKIAASVTRFGVAEWHFVKVAV